MTRQNRARGSGQRSRPRAEDRPIEDLLDRFEQALQRADQAAMVSLTESIWQQRTRIPEILARRVVEGRARFPGIALDMLAGLAGQKARPYLRRIADDRGTPDIVRFGAQRRVGWPERGAAKRRLAFLDSLENPEQTLILAIDQGMASWPPECQVLGEVLDYLTALPSPRAQAIVSLAVSELDEDASWLLHALLEAPDVDLARCAILGLEQIRDGTAVPALRRLARATGVAELQTEATRVADGLARLLSSRQTTRESEDLPPTGKALLSIVDGNGAQTVLVIRSIGDQVALMANYLTTDTWGIKDAFGQDRIAEAEVTSTLDEFAREGVYLVEADLAACRGALECAVDVNSSTGKGIPPIFEIWEPFLHASYPPPLAEEKVVPELDDTPYAGRTDLLTANGELLAHRFFESWAFAPEEIGLAMITTPLPTQAGRRAGLGPLIAHALRPDVRARYRQRLRRQAWLLDRVGDEHARDLALATAASLIDTSPQELATQPFFQEMASRGFEGILANLLGRFGGL